MFRQTYWGLRAIAAISRPILPWNSPAPGAIVEVLPAHVASVMCPNCRYKGKTPQARAERQRLLAVLVSACRFDFSPQDEQVIVLDTEGDALDAVLAAIAAGAARQRGFSGVPPHVVTNGEGWIYSVS